MTTLPAELGQWLSDGRLAIQFLRETLPLLPKGKPKEQVEAAITSAEGALKSSNAALAQSLGYKLCRCSWPPTIMLWDQTKLADVCESCGHEVPHGMRISAEALAGFSR